MAPDIEHCETQRLNEEQAVPVHHGRRILPDGQPPASAWAETEDERPGDNTSSPGENKRLLPSGPPARHKSRLQAGLTLGVHPPVKYKYPPATKSQKTFLKSKSDKKKSERKANLIALLKPPYFIVSMIIVNVLIHESIKDADVRALLQWNPDSWWREPWRLVTYGCVHASHLHLALNSLVALAVGWPLEREQGWWRVVVLWVGGLAAGALGAGLLQYRVRVVGASAAVYALLTAHISNVCLRHGHISLWWFRPLSVLVLGASEVCWALVRTPAAARAPPGGEHMHSPYEYVAWAAHILGAVVGVPLAFVVFTGENSRKAYVIACRVVSGMALVAGVVVAAVCYARAAAAEYSEEDMT
ncbi:rhomboid-related protein 1 [Spodoptera frugiperda]|uniref:Rhomboid-related protein 1 n=1 Tax=Spodoptera frugiperda TaxID=7108 RepID=A0A2H1V845_SPOFR|nr:rhomboid-related protein 1 [Spodoptera frugiperda]XP_035436229.1 rhomboid-related protein 1 [Spodoptera frugiperda]XP_035436230.1 rhomboid-related protein 1 [Spodoptera frugiperda]